MEKEFNEAKSNFIVNENEYPKEKLTKFMKTLTDYAKISKDGQVVVIKSVSTRKILKLILSVRFIANQVDKEISEWIGKEELSSYSYLKKEVFSARIHDLFHEGFADKKEEKFKARNILLVERFLEELEEVGKNE